jgi:hypothetical protein
LFGTGLAFALVFAFAGDRLCLLMASATLLEWRAKTASVGQEGNTGNALSPTGSTHRWLPMRVTNDRVAASRARLTNGHEAPGVNRPRTHAGPSILTSNDYRQRQKKQDTNSNQVHGASGAAQAANWFTGLGSLWLRLALRNFKRRVWG